MKARELAELLMKNPDDEVLIGSDSPEHLGAFVGVSGGQRCVVRPTTTPCRDMIDGPTYDLSCWAPAYQDSPCRTPAVVLRGLS